jgi:hypothetical protein
MQGALGPMTAGWSALALLFFSIGVRGTAAVPSDEKALIEAQVLRDFLRDVPASEKDIGVDCPRGELARIQRVFGSEPTGSITWPSEGANGSSSPRKSRAKASARRLRFARRDAKVTA